MKFSLLLFVCVLYLIQSIEGKRSRKKPKAKLYGSRDAQDSQFPYTIFQIRRSARSYHTCSGSIVSERWVLTAAHCVNSDLDPRSHLVVAGKADLMPYVRHRYTMLPFHQNVNESLFNVQEKRVSAVFAHPLFSRAGSHDVGLIRVATPFNFNSQVARISISRDAFTERTDCTLVGYGLVENDVRRYKQQFITNMPARPAMQCRRQRLRDVICLGDTTRGICHGDSGGPLVCGGEVRGVASHGVSSERGCGRGTLEQFYADTERNLRWIDIVMNGSE